MNGNAMDLDRLRQLCEAHGGDPRRWPSRERAAAEAYAAGSAAARELLREAAQLDAWLDRRPAVSASPELRARVLAGIPQPRRRRLSWPSLAGVLAMPGLRYAIPALLAALVLGMTLGGTAPVDNGDSPDLLQIAVVQGNFEDY